MLPDVDYVQYRCPSHKAFPPRHKKLVEAEEMIQKMRLNSKHRLQVAIHEANHSLVAKSFGLETTYGGQAIEHVRETDQWIVVFGRVEVPAREYQKLTVEQMAQFNLAGRVAEIVLLGNAPLETSQLDCESFIYCGKDLPSRLLLKWKLTEERMIRDLRANLAAQQAIVHEAAVFEQQIFGIKIAA